jgi:tRNA pseudouridine-54 N-methylase
MDNIRNCISYNDVITLNEHKTSFFLQRALQTQMELKYDDKDESEPCLYYENSSFWYWFVLLVMRE